MKYAFLILTLLICWQIGPLQAQKQKETITKSKVKETHQPNVKKERSSITKQNQSLPTTSDEAKKGEKPDIKTSSKISPNKKTTTDSPKEPIVEPSSSEDDTGETNNPSNPEYDLTPVKERAEEDKSIDIGNGSRTIDDIIIDPPREYDPVDVEATEEEPKPRANTIYTTPNEEYVDLHKKAEEFRNQLRKAKDQLIISKMMQYFEDAESLCGKYSIDNCASDLKRTYEYLFEKAERMAQERHNSKAKIEALEEVKKVFCSSNYQVPCGRIYSAIDFSYVTQQMRIVRWSTNEKANDRIRAANYCYKTSKKRNFTNVLTELEQLVPNMMSTWLNANEFDLALTLCKNLPDLLTGCESQIRKKHFEHLMQQVVKSKNIAAQKRLLKDAKSICDKHALAITDCQKRVDKGFVAVYEKEINAYFTSVSKSNSYEDQLKQLAKVKALLGSPYLSKSHDSRYDQMLLNVHRSEYEKRLTAAKQTTSYSSRLDHFAHAARLFSAAQISDSKRTVHGQLVEDTHQAEVNRLINLNGSFQEYMSALQKAERIDQTYLDGKLNANVFRKRKNVVLKQFSYLKSTINTRGSDWEEMLGNYANSIQFVNQYRKFINAGEKVKLENSRESYLTNQYSTAINRTRSAITNGELGMAEQSLYSLDRLFNSPFFTAGNQNHYDLYQKLDDALLGQLKRAKNKNDWAAVDKLLNGISRVRERGGANINFEMSIADHRSVVNRNKLDYLIVQAERKMDLQETRFEAYLILGEALNLYQKRKGDMTDSQKEQLIENIGYTIEKTSASSMDSVLIRAVDELSNLIALIQIDKQKLFIDHTAQEVVKKWGVKVYKNAFSDLQNEQGKVLSIRQKLTAIEFLERSSRTHEDFLNTKFKSNIENAYQSVLMDMVAEGTQTIVAGDFNLKEEFTKIDSLQLAHRLYLSKPTAQSAKDHLSLALVLEKGKKALRSESFRMSLAHFVEADSFAMLLANIPAEQTATIDKGKQAALSGAIAQDLTTIAAIKEEEKRNEAYKELISFRVRYEMVPLDESIRKEVKVIADKVFSLECGAANENLRNTLADGDREAKAKNYLKAEKYYNKALSIVKEAKKCELDETEIEGRFAKYALALTFIKAKDSLIDLRDKVEPERYTRDYQALWDSYVSNDIESEFGLTLTPYADHIIALKSEKLIRFYILNHCSKPNHLSGVNQALQTVLEDSATYMDWVVLFLGENMAITIYKNKPEKSYKNSFKYFKYKPSDAISKKRFKAFKKAYKTGWKTALKAG